MNCVSHSSGYEEAYLLGYKAIYSDDSQWTTCPYVPKFATLHRLLLL